MRPRLGVLATLVFDTIFVLADSPRNPSAGPFESEITMSVGVFNLASVPPGILQAAQVGAGQVFAEAGVQLRWVLCPCESEGELPQFNLRIIPKLFGSWQSPFGARHLGFAAVDETGGILATIFYDRVDWLAKGGDLSQALGLAIAHELGHLLLGSAAHTKRGIMQPYLSRKDLRGQRASRLIFDPVQIQHIHHKLVAGEGGRKTRASGQRPSGPRN
ncbi:MAG: hypothetical protein AB1898_22750 [Acidobacteriota bacterium]